jgi:hypothetical protein
MIFFCSGLNMNGQSKKKILLIQEQIIDSLTNDYNLKQLEHYNNLDSLENKMLFERIEHDSIRLALVSGIEELALITDSFKYSSEKLTNKLKLSNEALRKDLKFL